MTERNEIDPRLLLGPVEPEVECDICFELLDQYVDRHLHAGDAATEMPRLAAHLRGCPVCHEEYESLLALASQD